MECLIDHFILDCEHFNLSCFFICKILHFGIVDFVYIEYVGELLGPRKFTPLIANVKK